MDNLQKINNNCTKQRIFDLSQKWNDIKIWFKIDIIQEKSRLKT